jgi:hypothetical protein
MVAVAARAPYRSVDWTVADDADRLGQGWVDGHDWDPTAFEPVGIRDGAMVVTDPQARTGATYNANQNQAAPEMYASGQQYLGIACAWRETGLVAPTVTYTWSGHHSPQHVETAPLINVTPGHPDHAFGAWTSMVLGAPVIYVGVIGSPPELFDIDDLGGFSHTTGTPRVVQLRSNGTGVTVWIDGVQISMSVNGLNPVPIRAALLGSTKHGVAIDAHLASPAAIPTVPAVTAWSIT